MNHKVLLLIMITFLSPIPLAFSQALQQTDLIYAKRHMLHSKILNEDREVEVYLPPSYYQTENHHSGQGHEYPVIVVIGGESFFRTVSGIVEHLSDVSRMPESIVVGLPNNTGKGLQMLPKIVGDDGKPFIPDSLADEYIQFYQQELFPHLESTYRVAKFRTLIGWSNQSAFALHAFVKAPELFQATIAIAPFLNHGYKVGDTFVDAIAKPFAKTPNRKAWLYVGMSQSDVESNPQGKVSLQNLQQQLSPYTQKHLTLKTEVLAGEHHFSMPLPAVMSALDMIYPREKFKAVNFSREVIGEPGETVANIDAIFNKLSADYGFKTYPLEHKLGFICRRLIRQKRFDDAKAVIERWRELYPKSSEYQTYLQQTNETN
ncbi:MAG: alpha/beta hydrolase-fold protein [Psychrosphaera sp.]|nr:alpha/beta hydrolase-fold protein [Psychrosphaera sp.]